MFKLIVKMGSLTPEQAAWVQDYFVQETASLIRRFEQDGKNYLDDAEVEIVIETANHRGNLRTR